MKSYYASKEIYDRRALVVYPDVDAIDACLKATEAMRAASMCISNVLEECANVICYTTDVINSYDAGELDMSEFDYSDVLRLKGEQKTALRIVKAMGYEVDGYFCGYPKFKRVLGGDL